MGTNKIDILKQSSKFTSINIIGKLFIIPRQIIVALVLSPTDLGIVGYVMLWVMYASWIKTGAVATLPIELPGLLKNNQYEKALNSQYIAWSADFCLGFIIFIGLIIAAFFQSSILIKNLLIIGALVYAVQMVAQYLHSMNWVRLRFSKLAKVQLYITIVPTVLTLLLLYWFKIYTLLLVPLISGIINIILLLRIRGVSFEFRFERKELFRLMRTGIVLTLASILYAGFVGIVDNTIISKYLSFEQLGLFIFAYTFMSMILQGFKDFGDVLTPILYGNLETASSDLDAFKNLNKIAIYFSILSCITMTLSQIGFIILVGKITIKYSASKLVFIFLSTQIFLGAMSIIPSLILQSNRVKKEKLVLIAISVGLLLNIIFDIIVMKLGYGIVGVAIVTTATQGFVNILMYFFSRKYITSSTKHYFLFILKLITPFVFAIILTFINWVILKYFETWSFVGLSTVINLTVWTILVLTFYPDHFNKSKLKMFKNAIFSDA